jgi:hypothetical protein
MPEEIEAELEDDTADEPALWADMRAASGTWTVWRTPYYTVRSARPLLSSSTFGGTLV